MTSAAAYLLCLSGVVFAVPVSAQTELRPTPDYFAQAVFDMSTAQALSRSCSTVTVEPGAAAERATALLRALEADGFSTDTPFAEMIDPNAAIRDLQAGFVERYGLEQPDEARVCEVAMAEMEAGTGLGLLLVTGQN